MKPLAHAQIEAIEQILMSVEIDEPLHKGFALLFENLHKTIDMIEVEGVE